MSLMNIKHTMDRIKTAIPSSPIAVFRCDKKGLINAVFADTVKTQQMIAAGNRDLIGVYDGSMNLYEIEKELLENVE